MSKIISKTSVCCCHLHFDQSFNITVKTFCSIMLHILFSQLQFFFRFNLCCLCMLCKVKDSHTYCFIGQMRIVILYKEMTEFSSCSFDTIQAFCDVYIMDMEKR